MHDSKEIFSSIIVGVFNISPDLGGDVQDLDVSIAPRGGQGGGGTFGAVRPAAAIFRFSLVARRIWLEVLIDSLGMLEIFKILPPVLPHVPFVLHCVMVPIVGRHQAHGPYYLTNLSTGSSSGHGPDLFFGPVGWCHCRFGLGSKCSNWLVQKMNTLTSSKFNPKRRRKDINFR